MDKNTQSYLFYFSVGLNIALIIVLAVDFFHLPMFHFNRDFRPDRSRFFREKLGLREEKWKKLRPRMNQFKRNYRGIGRQIGESRRKMMDLLSKQQVDTPAVQNQRERLLNFQREKYKLWMDHILEIKNILSREEQQKLFEIFKKHTGSPRSKHGPPPHKK
ncbi:MAG: periplasmic heavy metal sensor [bacterium]